MGDITLTPPVIETILGSNRWVTDSWVTPNKGPSSQSCGFPVVMYGCESWTIKKTEGRRIDTFELWCWRRLLRVPWTVRRSNQSVLKEINRLFIGETDSEAEAPILWPPDVESWLIRKILDAEKEWRQEEKRMAEDEMVGWHYWLYGR